MSVSIGLRRYKLFNGNVEIWLFFFSSCHHLQSFHQYLAIMIQVVVGCLPILFEVLWEDADHYFVSPNDRYVNHACVRLVREEPKSPCFVHCCCSSSRGHELRESLFQWDQLIFHCWSCGIQWAMLGGKKGKNQEMQLPIGCGASVSREE